MASCRCVYNRVPLADVHTGALSPSRPDLGCIRPYKRVAAFTASIASRGEGLSLTSLRAGLRPARIFQLPRPTATRPPHVFRSSPGGNALLFLWRPSLLVSLGTAGMPRRQSPQQVTDLPFSQPEAAAVVVAEAAAVLAGMPRRQAQLQWASPGGATDRSSDLEPPPPSPAVSAARPPLAAHAQLAGGASVLAFPPRRGGALSTSVVAPHLRAGASATAGVTPPHRAAAQRTGGVVTPLGTAPRTAGVRLTPRRVIPTATGRLPATRRTPAVSTGKRALERRPLWLVEPQVQRRGRRGRPVCQALRLQCPLGPMPTSAGVKPRAALLSL